MIAEATILHGLGRDALPGKLHGRIEKQGFLVSWVERTYKETRITNETRILHWLGCKVSQATLEWHVRLRFGMGWVERTYQECWNDM